MAARTEYHALAELAAQLDVLINSNPAQNYPRIAESLQLAEQLARTELGELMADDLIGHTSDKMAAERTSS